nr:hypothetical protein CFP56_56489 [Quercus suber]
MASHDQSSTSSGTDQAHSLEHTTDLKVFREAVVAETSIWKRGQGDTTFDNESLESLYKPIESYEGYHRFDPDFQWDRKEEQRVVRKIDYKICTPVRQHADRPEHDDQRLQYRPNHLLPLLPVRRAPLATHLQTNRAGQLDPDPDGGVVPHRLHAGLPLRPLLLLDMPGAPGLDRRRLHPGQHPLPVILVHQCRAPDPTLVLLDGVSVHVHHQYIPGVRHPAYAWHQRSGGMAVAVCPRGNVDRSDRYRVILLPPAFAHADEISIPRERRLVLGAGREDHGLSHVAHILARADLAAALDPDQRLPDPGATRRELRHFRDESADDPGVCLVHRRTAVLDVGQPETERCLLGRHGQSALEFAIADSTGVLASPQKSMGELDPGDIALCRTLHACGDRGGDKPKCWIGADKNDRNCLV